MTRGHGKDDGSAHGKDRRNPAGAMRALRSGGAADVNVDVLETPEALHAHAVGLLRQKGEIDESAELECELIEGGVSATVLRLRSDDGRSWCAKRPRTRLRVAASWQAPLERVRAEADWLEIAGAWQSGAVPDLVARDDDAYVIVMSDHPPPAWRPWKPSLLEGRIDPDVGRQLGELVGALHARSAQTPELAERFANDALFHALRVRPFLNATIEAHPDLQTEIRALEQALKSGPGALVHGDVSPKNLLVHQRAGIKLLDAECACWLAPHFDVAFCETHLLLKWAHHPEPVAGWLTLLRSFRSAWNAARGGTAGDAEDACATRLLPALMLARIDGMSTVDYLSAESAARVRSFARTQLRAAPDDMTTLLRRFERAMGDID